MPSVASVDPFWSVTLRSLRELTRLAFAALVLAVGLGGAATAPTPSAAVPGPAAVIAVGPAAASLRAAQSLPVHGPTAEQADHTAAPQTARRADTSAGASTVPAARPDAPARGPGRGVPARRGPPTA
ncbi:hypothetical protein AB0D32_12055 [Micromonospora sp. NPDC048170]|uniref:hypothetical protein n=1 Tax=Micromonospora sp. NPDC048170 TaxID=3154819 RepID=UPI0033F1A864